MNDAPDFTALLRCPSCLHGSLVRQSDDWRCAGCAAHFPELDGIPFLFPEPARARGEWRMRLHALLAELRREAEQYRTALDRGPQDVLARNRLKLLAAAFDDHARRLAALLSPLGIVEPGPALETHRALGTRIPGAQGLVSYYVNVHRDWAWGAEENEAAFQSVSEVLGPEPPGKVLVLGAGAGRLVYDLHERLSPQMTVALDLNPFLAFVARRMFAGERVALYEFPIAPRDIESHAILRTLGAGQPARRGLHLVLGDASRAPFAPGSFDVVVTPWLIDVLDEDFTRFAPRVNEMLRPGGRWVNTGSLAFAHADPAARYSLEEVVKIVGQAGFAPPRVMEDRWPYMWSPASRHGRVESVVTFVAVKESDVPLPGDAALPAWLARYDQPVPALPEFQEAALSMRVYGFVATLIDGQRSIAEIARVLVQERLMTQDTAESAVHGFVRKLYEEARRRTRF